MSFHRADPPEIPPFGVESWADQSADTFIEDIRGLAVADAMHYVGQRQIFDFDPLVGPVNVGSGGFGKCSGLLLRDCERGTYTFSHLEPFPDTFHDRMRTGQRDPVRWVTPHDAVLIYGSVSSRQCEIERLMSEQFWGPASVRTIQLETGRTHWGLVFYGLLGQLAMVRKKPDQSIVRYQLFEPTVANA